MTTPTNILQQVATYQKAALAYLLNKNVAIRIANKKFKDFNNITANLGSTVTFEKPFRAVSGSGLVVTFGPTQERVQTLSCTQAAFTAVAYTNQEQIFNVDRYMDEIGRAQMEELGTKPETDLLKNFTSSVTVSDPQNPLNGQNIDPTSGPFRFYGDGNTAINSYGQLAQICANQDDFGSSRYNGKVILPVTIIPSIINSGLAQFATNRNNENAMDWELGDWNRYEWYESNLLPTHIAGTAGQTGAVLTLTGTNDPTGNAITQLTFSSTLGNDANAIKSGDLCQFLMNVAGQQNITYLTWTGHVPSRQPVQFRVTADAASAAGNITMNIYPPLQSTIGLNQNLSSNLTPGMQIFVANSHVAGGLMTGDCLYMAMPRLRDENPFETIITTDEDSGASIRHYWGSQFGLNSFGYIWDMIWASTLIAENTQRILIPLTQTF